MNEKPLRIDVRILFSIPIFSPLSPIEQSALSRIICTFHLTYHQKMSENQQLYIEHSINTKNSKYA